MARRAGILGGGSRLRDPLGCGRPWLAFALALAACGAEGRLLISLELPSDQSFDPMQDARLSKFSLRVTEGASYTDQETLRTESTELRLGQVPVGEAFDLRLAGRSGTGQMLGLGQMFDLKVSGEGDTPVAVKFRKPIGFVSGAPGLELLDTTAAKRDKVPLTALSAQSVADVAATPDGAWLLAAAGSSLLAFRTADRKQWAEVKLSAPATCVAVSPGNRYAVVCHASSQSVSIVDLARLAESQADVRPVTLGGVPTKVVFGRERTLARVLVDGVGFGQACGPKSRLVELDASTGSKRTEVALDRSVADLAVDPRDGRVLLAVPCEGKLARVEGQSVATIPTAVPRAYDMALTDQFLVILGATETSSSGQAVLIDLTKQGFSAQTKTFGLPVVAIPLTGAGEGELAWLVDVKTYTIFDIAVAPDGQRAVALFKGTYTSSQSYNGCQYNAQLDLTGYLLVDLAVESVVYSRLTSLGVQQCSIICGSPQSCATGMRDGLKQSGTLASTEFTPTGAILLFGGS